jgi:hypothetical protein
MTERAGTIRTRTTEKQLVEEGGENAAPPRRNSLHRRHFAPLSTTPRPTARTVWGTRGPRFKSGRPDCM